MNFKHKYVFLLPGLIVLIGILIFPIIFTVIFLLGTLTEIYVTEYAITNKRVIIKRGLIVRVVEEMNLGSIEGVNLRQGIIGRILNYGSIMISGRGTSDVQFKDIDNPVETRKKIKDCNSSYDSNFSGILLRNCSIFWAYDFKIYSY